MLCVVRDIVDPVQDQRLAEFVVGSHAASHPEAVEEAEAAADTAAANGQRQQHQNNNQDPDILDQDTLRKYITYAKQQYKPAMSQVGVQAFTVAPCVGVVAHLDLTRIALLPATVCQ